MTPKLRLVSIFFIFTIYTVHAQSTSDSDFFRNKILDDIKALKSVYRTGITSLTNPTIHSIIILKIDSIIINNYVTFYKVDVDFLNSVINITKPSEIKQTYIFVQESGWKTYCLFGFFSSDIYLWHVDHHKSYPDLKSILLKSGLFNKHQLKNIITSLKKQSLFLDTRADLPCNILKQYYPQEKERYKASSYIIYDQVSKFNEVH